MMTKNAGASIAVDADIHIEMFAEKESSCCKTIVNKYLQFLDLVGKKSSCKFLL